jgi:hypothetical protein
VDVFGAAPMMFRGFSGERNWVVGCILAGLLRSLLPRLGRTLAVAAGDTLRILIIGPFSFAPFVLDDFDFVTGLSKTSTVVNRVGEESQCSNFRSTSRSAVRSSQNLHGPPIHL